MWSPYTKDVKLILMSGDFTNQDFFFVEYESKWGTEHISSAEKSAEALR